MIVLKKLTNIGIVRFCVCQIVLTFPALSHSSDPAKIIQGMTLARLSISMRLLSIFRAMLVAHLCIVNIDINSQTKAMANFNVPGRGEVSASNQEIFDKLEKGLGMVPNLYGVMAHSDSALANYLAFQNAKTTFSNKEKQAINLVVSQVNECLYCQSAHTALGKMNGLTEEQTIEIRKGGASFDKKLNALVTLAAKITAQKGIGCDDAVEAFLEAGYTRGQAVELVMLVAEKTAMNYLYGITKVAIDFPLAQSI